MLNVIHNWLSQLRSQTLYLICFVVLHSSESKKYATVFGFCLLLNPDSLPVDMEVILKVFIFENPEIVPKVSSHVFRIVSENTNVNRNVVFRQDVYSKKHILFQRNKACFKSIILFGRHTLIPFLLEQKTQNPLLFGAHRLEVRG